MALEILKDIQLDLMLVLSGISAAAAFFMALSKSLDKETSAAQNQNDSQDDAANFTGTLWKERSQCSNFIRRN